MSRAVTGTIYHPGTTIKWVGAIVKFRLIAYFATATISFPAETQEVVSDADGKIATVLATPTTGSALYACTLPGDTKETFSFYIQTNAVAITLEELINGAGGVGIDVDPLDTLLGALLFTDLADTPDSYVGKSLQGVRVNVGETGLEFSAAVAGVTDHGALTGLADDDHPQYHNDVRGDLRYWPLTTDLATQAELNTALLAYLLSSNFTWANIGGKPTTLAGFGIIDAASDLELANHEADTTNIHGIANTAALAPLASPALTGVPTAPTAALGTDTIQLATTAFARAEIAALVGGSPATLDTLNELAAALGSDPNFASTMTAALGGKEPSLGNPASNGYLLSSTTLGVRSWRSLVAADTPAAAILAAANVFTLAQAITLSDAVTSTATTLATLGHNSSGTPAASFGSRLLFNLKSDTTIDRNAAAIDAIWTTAADATRTSNIVFNTVNNAGTLVEMLRIAPTVRIPATSEFGIGPSATLSVAGNLFRMVGGSGTGLTFYSDGAERMRLLNSPGYFGIGTIAPVSTLHAVRADALVAVTNAFTIGHNTSGAPVTNYGTGILLQGQSSTTINRDMAQIATLWTDATDATRTSALVFNTVISSVALAEQMRIGPVGLGIGTNDPLNKLHVNLLDAITSSVVSVARIAHNSSGTPVAGFGARLLFSIKSSTTADQAASSWDALWADATDVTRKARIVGNVYDTAVREWIRGEADGSNPMIGFLGATAKARQTVAADATDLATALTLVNDIKAKLGQSAGFGIFAN